MFNRHRRSEKAITRQNSGGKKFRPGNELAQAKQRCIAQFAIALQLLGDEFAIRGGPSQVNHDQIGPKPTRSMHGKGGVMLLPDRISAHAFERFTHRPSDARFTINDQDFFANLHNDGRLRASLVPLPSRPDLTSSNRLDSNSHTALVYRYHKPATILTVRARITVLNANDRIP